MTVEVLYFAALREIRGCASESMDIEPGTTAGALYARLFPDHHGSITVAFTRNQAVCSAATALLDGDEVGFLPPLGGG